MTVKALTVKDLKAILTDVPDDTLVVLSSDVEGNAFSPLCAFSTGSYTFGQKSWQKGNFFDDGDQMPDNKQAEKAVALWPMH
jgi:hypothetical protein